MGKGMLFKEDHPTAPGRQDTLKGRMTCVREVGEKEDCGCDQGVLCWGPGPGQW